MELNSELIVYYRFGPVHRYDVTDLDFNKLMAEVRKLHPRAYKFVLRYYVDHYVNWDMTNETLDIRVCAACGNGFYIAQLRSEDVKKAESRKPKATRPFEEPRY
jgi:hypothetical protein